MGTVLASAIMAAATGILNEEAQVNEERRWTDAWLFDGVNRGQREICFIKPDAYVLSGPVKLAVGTWQSLAANELALLRISHNMSTDGLTPGRMVTKVELDKIMAWNPHFASMDPSATVRHYAYDAATPRLFAVIPPQPASGQGYVFMQRGALVEDLVKPAGSYDVAINLGDEYQNALVYFVVFWAYAKDSDFSPSARDRAASWYQIFAGLVGKKEQVEAAAVAPAASQHNVG